MTRVLCLLFAFSVLFGCDSPPTFEGVVKNYVEKELVFTQLADYACSLGEDGSLSYYSPNSQKHEANIALDEMLESIGGKSILYRPTGTFACGLIIDIWVTGFAGSGQHYRYKFNLDSPKPFNKKRHTKEIIFREKTEVMFDLPLKKSKQFKGWYFSYFYR